MKILTEQEVRERVARGAELLDRRRLLWREEISSPIVSYEFCGCVLGQVYGEYHDGLEQLGLIDEDGNWDVEGVASYGFTLKWEENGVDVDAEPETERNWALLDEAWSEVLSIVVA